MKIEVSLKRLAFFIFIGSFTQYHIACSTMIITNAMPIAADMFLVTFITFNFLANR